MIAVQIAVSLNLFLCLLALIFSLRAYITAKVCERVVQQWYDGLYSRAKQ